MSQLQQDIITAIQNHTVLLIASAEADELHAMLLRRLYNVQGMLELVRRLPGQHALVVFCRQHIDMLEQHLANT